METILITVLVVPVLVILAAVFIGISKFNTVTALDERCKTALSDIDALMKARLDLVPAMVETVRGFKDHETGLLTQVLDAQREALGALDTKDKIFADKKLSVSLNKLISASDLMPQTAVAEDFRSLRHELIKIEERLVGARRYYNLTVEEFNATRRQFPANLVSGFAGLSNHMTYDLGSARMMAEEAPQFRL